MLLREIIAVLFVSRNEMHEFTVWTRCKSFLAVKLHCALKCLTEHRTGWLPTVIMITSFDCHVRAFNYVF